MLLPTVKKQCVTEPEGYISEELHTAHYTLHRILNIPQEPEVVALVDAYWRLVKLHQSIATNKLAVQVTQKPITLDLANQLMMALDFCDHPRLSEYVVVNNIPCDLARMLWSMDLNDRPFPRDVASFFKDCDYVDSMVNALANGHMREVFYGIHLQVLRF